MPKLSLSKLPPYMNSRCCIWEEAYLLPRGSLCLSGGVKWGFPCGSAGKESTCNVGDLGSIPGLGRSPGEGKGYPRQYPGLENCVDCIVHGSQRVGHDWATFTHSHSLTGMLLLLLSRFSCVRLCATPKTAAHQASPSLGFSRQEHWSGLPLPSPMHESEK